MYKEAYELIREILEDDKLNEFVHKTTGKRLAIIDSGPKVTFPAVGIVYRDGEISRPDNNMQEVQYDIPFGLPYFDANAMARCHEFLDVVIDAFFAHERLTEGRRNFVKRVEPLLVEDDPEEKWWTVAVRATIAIF